jgi:hypothetical protein
MAREGPLGFFTLRGRDHRGTLRVPLLMASEEGPLEFFTLQGKDHKVFFTHGEGETLNFPLLMTREGPWSFLYT